MSTNVENIISLAEDRVLKAIKNDIVAEYLESLIFSEESDKKLPVVIPGVEFYEAVEFAAACLLYHGNVQVEPIVNSFSYYMVSSKGCGEAAQA